RLELVEPGHGRMLRARTIDVPVAEPFAFADSLYRGAAVLLGLSPRLQTAQHDLGVQGAGTLRFTMQAIGRMRTARSAADWQRAIDELETARRTEPDAGAPAAWLASAELSAYNATKDSAWLVRGEAAAREAVALDSTRSYSHRVLASALGLR